MLGTHLSHYHEMLDNFLDSIVPPSVLFCTAPHCNDFRHKKELEDFHESIMKSIVSADRVFPRVKKGLEKSWWSHELSEAKKALSGCSSSLEGYWITSTWLYISGKAKCQITLQETS